MGGGFRRHVSRHRLTWRQSLATGFSLPVPTTGPCVPATHGPVEAERAGETGRRPHEHGQDQARAALRRPRSLHLCTQATGERREGGHTGSGYPIAKERRATHPLGSRREHATEICCATRHRPPRLREARVERAEMIRILMSPRLTTEGI